MQSKLNPYLHFRDNTRQAMEFYQSVFGGNLTVSTFGEFQASPDGSENDNVMHSMLEADNGITFMAADVPKGMEHTVGTNINMSLSGDNEPELRGYFDKLSEGGTAVMPLEPAPWGDTFGMCVDKFGINWLVNISPKDASAE